MGILHHYARALALFILFALSLISLSHSRVLLNTPSYGGELEVLVENEPAPQYATIIAPDGQRINVSFEGSQLRYQVQQYGTWAVEVNGFSYSVVVSAPFSPPQEMASADSYSWQLSLSLAAAVIIGLILSAISIYFLFMRPTKQIPPILEKKREGDVVRIRLCAGTLPLSEIMLQDEVGRGFKDGPKKMSRAKLEAGQTMELSYAWAGPLGEVSVRFTMDDLPCEMKCTTGVVGMNENSDEMDSVNTAPPQSIPSPTKKQHSAPSRKLSRKKN